MAGEIYSITDLMDAGATVYQRGVFCNNPCGFEWFDLNPKKARRSFMGEITERDNELIVHVYDRGRFASLLWLAG